MRGRFGQYESEAEVRSRYPVHEDEPPPRFRRMQLYAVLAVVGAALAIYLLSLALR